LTKYQHITKSIFLVKPCFLTLVISIYPRKALILKVFSHQLG